MTPATILLVEDNATTRKLVRFTLERRGHRVLEAPDGKTARELMARHTPALVLQDLILPDMDGFELLAQLRQCRGGTEVPVLAFSGFVSKLEEARISAVGFNDVITKPIEPSRLVVIVEAHLPHALAAGEQFGAGKRLLVVDDDPIQLKLTRFQLARLGFEVDAAGDGEEALRKSRLARPSAVVSDVMMPGLDGFGLALALRRDPELRDVPIVLVTASYVEPADRELARKVGASDLVARTPDLDGLIPSLRASLQGARLMPAVEAPALAELEMEHARRTVRQLERQVLHNSSLGRRCSSLAAELTVLTGISDMVLNHRDIETTLDDALAACLDAGGISVGALYLLDSAGLHVRPLGGEAGARSAELRTFFGHEELLQRIARSGAAVSLPSDDFSDLAAREVLERSGAGSMLVVPIVHQGRSLGALLTLGKERDSSQGDWGTFVQGVANQIAQTLTLAGAFSEREAAARLAVEQKQIADGRAALLRVVFEQIGLLAERLGLSDVARVQSHVLHLAMDVGAASPDFVLGPDFLAEFLSPFESTFRGHVDANERLAQLNEELAGRNRELSEASAATKAINEELEAFSYSVAHDLRGPLRAINGFSTALLEDWGDRFDADARGYLARIMAGADRMAELIDSLLGLARVTRAEPRRARVELTELAHKVIDLLRASEPSRAVEFLAPERLMVEGDPELLRSLLENLLGNAWKFTGKRELARIELGSDGQLAERVYFVRDNGSGFDMAHVGKLFAPFRRLHSSQEFAGTGIGLATVQRIVRRHGGRIWAEAAENVGATFYFSLPSVN